MCGGRGSELRALQDFIISAMRSHWRLLNKGVLEPHLFSESMLAVWGGRTVGRLSKRMMEGGSTRHREEEEYLGADRL